MSAKDNLNSQQFTPMTNVESGDMIMDSMTRASRIIDMTQRPAKVYKASEDEIQGKK